MLSEWQVTHMPNISFLNHVDFHPPLYHSLHLEGRKTGSHALRHSLASRLLEHEIPLPVISEILGHVNTQTTMTYLRIDINELKKCALEVMV